MARPKSLDKPQNVCPSCNTRLRISLQRSDRVECQCPECNAPLIAQLGESGAVEVSKPEPPAPKAASPKTAPDWSTSFWPGRTRTVAAAVTAFVGLLIVAAVTQSGNESETEPADDAAAAVDSAAQKLPHQPTPADDYQKTEDKVFAPATPPTLDADLPRKTPSDSATAASPDSPSNASGTTLKISQKNPDNPSVLLVAATEAPAESSTQGIPKNTVPVDAAPIADPTVNSKPTSRPMSLRQRLGISIRSFRQEKPISLRDLIQTVENMCQIRVNVSAVSAVHLDKQVSFSQVETTPNDILTEAARKCGLRVIVAENSIQLVSETE